MTFSRSVFLLFALNIIDAVITLMWIRNGWATEGNYLMATVLDFGEGQFLAVKVFMGLIAAVSLTCARAGTDIVKTAATARSPLQTTFFM